MSQFISRSRSIKLGAIDRLPVSGTELLLGHKDAGPNINVTEQKRTLEFCQRPLCSRFSKSPSYMKPARKRILRILFTIWSTGRRAFRCRSDLLNTKTTTAVHTLGLSWQSKSRDSRINTHTEPQNPEGFLTGRPDEVWLDPILVNVDVTRSDVLPDRDGESRTVG